jgi:MFS superfamily sulfate permease-like transporter
LFLNIAKLVEESLLARGAFPSVLIIYFKNVPFLDGEAVNALKYIVKKAKDHSCLVIVSGTNGMLLEILKQKAQECNLGQVFGYIVPNFSEAVKKTLERMK